MAAGVLITPVLLSPMPRFSEPCSTIVEAADGTLLGARIADDGQWRFPGYDQIPDKFEKSLLTFEDRWFWYHPGVNPVSIMRALKGNMKAGEIRSGGSTITMQVARIAGGNKPRTYGRKMVEILSAFKLELFRSKRKILGMYAANAPFGGNTVGLEAASWRYTGKPSSALTWAEAAVLAILPNSPGLVYPGRNQQILRSKRDDLLRRLYDRGMMDSLTLKLSIDEPLPGEPGALPADAPHLTDYFYTSSRGSRIRTTIDHDLQERATVIINNHQRDLSSNYIFNSACIIVEVETGKVLAYVGNSTLPGTASHGGDVDIIRSPRSTGSILKPILYAAMQHSGDLLPNTLVADIPTRFPGFSPENFDMSFSGTVPAAQALTQSLNIPAVRMLQKYKTERFIELLRKTGFTSINRDADHYGLSLILGGGEASLWELAGVYASMSRVLNRFNREKKYYYGDYHPPVILAEQTADTAGNDNPALPLSASAIWLTYDALRKVNRPDNESGWQYFSSSKGIAWKTGTSFGFRDGWAIGTTPKYVIGVWTGNADGEGRPGLTGITAAAPVLFDLVNIIETGEWFEKPLEDIRLIRVCSESGCRAGINCPVTEEIAVSPNGLRSDACPYHRIVHLDRTGTMQVTSDCESPQNIINSQWFVLPPAMEYFYRQKHPGYRPLPPMSPGCRGSELAVMEFIYPSQGYKIFIPRDQTGLQTRMISEVAHRNPLKKIFWHLDEQFLGTTKRIHQIDIVTGKGIHHLTAVDEDGNSIKCRFEVI